jgi:hypothetical protein
MPTQEERAREIFQRHVATPEEPFEPVRAFGIYYPTGTTWETITEAEREDYRESAAYQIAEGVK